MSGHSAGPPPHKKAAVDARRGKMFARLIKNIEVAARAGGGDPAGNPTLYTRFRRRRRARFPTRTSERVQKRGAGEEGRRRRLADHHVRGLAAPNGAAVLTEVRTDDRNRASEVRVAMTRNGGTMADQTKSTAFRKGVVTLCVRNGLTEARCAGGCSGSWCRVGRQRPSDRFRGHLRARATGRGS